MISKNLELKVFHSYDKVDKSEEDNMSLRVK